MVAAGVDHELDELRELSRNGKQFLAQMEERERQRTGISSLKVRFNSVFGYYLEISKSNLHLVPPDYERRQTLANAERFSTPELKEYESKILDAEEKIVEIERRIFVELRAAIAARPAASARARWRWPKSTCWRTLPSWRPNAATRRPQFDASWRPRNPRRTPSGDRAAGFIGAESIGLRFL